MTVDFYGECVGYLHFNNKHLSPTTMNLFLNYFFVNEQNLDLEVYTSNYVYHKKLQDEHINGNSSSLISTLQC